MNAEIEPLARSLTEMLGAVGIRCTAMRKIGACRRVRGERRDSNPRPP
jgi:hypothetical protein